MENPTSLSVTQQFELEKLSRLVNQLSLEDARSMLIELLRHNMVKDNMVREMLRSERTAAEFIPSFLPGGGL